MILLQHRGFVLNGCGMGRGRSYVTKHVSASMRKVMSMITGSTTAKPLSLALELELPLILILILLTKELGRRLRGSSSSSARLRSYVLSASTCPDSRKNSNKCTSL